MMLSVVFGKVFDNRMIDTANFLVRASSFFENSMLFILSIVGAKRPP